MSVDRWCNLGSGPWHDSGSGMPQGSGGNRCDEAFCTGCLRYLYCETQEADANCLTDEAQQCMQRCSECPTPPGMDGDHSGYTGSGPSRGGSGSGPWHDSGMDSGDWSGMPQDSGSGMPQGSGGNRCDEAFCTGCLRYLYCETQEADANCLT